MNEQKTWIQEAPTKGSDFIGGVGAGTFATLELKASSGASVVEWIGTKFNLNFDSENDNFETAIDFQKKKVHALLILMNDEIIHDLYLKYESKFYITAKELIDRNFNWTIYKASITMNNLPAKSLIRYGYTLFNNQTVQLWKL
jgi:predicted Zn-dependent protease